MLFVGAAFLGCCLSGAASLVFFSGCLSRDTGLVFFSGDLSAEASLGLFSGGLSGVAGFGFPLDRVRERISRLITHYLIPNDHH